MKIKSLSRFLTVLAVLSLAECTHSPPSSSKKVTVNPLLLHRTDLLSWERKRPVSFNGTRPAAAFETTHRFPRTAAVGYEATDRFPRHPELEPQVAFWRKVYTTWSRSQVAVHDDRYLNVVYEIIELPGEIGESYNADQKDLVKQRRAYWQDRLTELEGSWASNLLLSSADQRLLALFESSGADPQAVSGAAQRVRVQRGLRERFKKGLEISARYEPIFRRIFREAGLPEELAYLPHVESSFQAHARSSAGAVGIWQFTRSAAQKYMVVNDTIDERLDPIASARGAARYLNYAHSKFQNWPIALTSYNHGIAGMQRARDTMGDDFIRIVQHYDHPKFGFASRNFYAEFLAAREIANAPQKFFPEGIRYYHQAPDFPPDFEIGGIEDPLPSLGAGWDITD